MVDIVEGREFSRLRRQAALADEDLARRLGVSVRTLARYETGESRPRPPVLEILKNLVNSPPCPSSVAGFSFIDLFAGIGGLRRGFEKA